MKLLFLPLLGLLLSGCIRSVPVVTVDLGGSSEPEQATVAEPLPELKLNEALDVETDTAPVGVVFRPLHGADPLSEATRQIGDLMDDGLAQARVQRLPMAILPFVERPKELRNDPLANRISESFIYQMQQRGYNLVDYQATSMVTTAKGSEAAQLSSLRSRFRVYFVLTGTYSRYPDGIVINARVLDTTTRQVLATGQAHVTNDQLEGMLPGFDPLKAARRGMIIENGFGPVE